jgi:hypothetical protein
MRATQMIPAPIRKPAAAPASVTPRPKRPLRSRAWWCMRVMPAFSADSLLLAIATGDEREARNNLVRYIASLEATGVIVRLPETRRGPAMWRLERDLGPLAPVVSRARGQISDPNSGALIDYITCEVPKC